MENMYRRELECCQSNCGGHEISYVGLVFVTGILARARTVLEGQLTRGTSSDRSS